MTGFGHNDVNEGYNSIIPTTLKVKYETPSKNSKRVKAVCFHSEMSWVLIALHSGVVQIWDYDYAVMCDEYNAHTGPCRAVDFHPNQPLFCTGGDDHLVKVFNYKKKQQLFDLSGHLDYVRSVQFHNEYPWILSASDDHMINIWNWQSRTSVAVLTGHSNYVMSAKFHPTEDLIVSASMDATVRVWDISKLSRFRSAAAGRGRSQYALPDDYKVQFVLTGHSKGVNWADFHPTMPYVVSGGDDRQVLVFQYSATNWTLMSTYKSHYANVCMVCFHPKTGYIISASEDNSIRVFPGIEGDGYTTDPLAVHRKENNRFWAVACHPYKNLVAVGHDTGTQVLKINRERVPAMTPLGLNDSRLFVIRNNWITVQDFEQQNIQQSLIKVPGQMTGTDRRSVDNSARALRVNVLNPSCNNFIITYQRESEECSGPFAIVAMTGGAGSPTGIVNQREGYGAAFVARNRFAVLESPTKLMVYDSNTMSFAKDIELTKRYTRLFFAGQNRVFLKSEFTLVLFDLTSRREIGQITIPPKAPIQHIAFDANLRLFAIVVAGVIGYRSTIIIGQIKDDAAEDGALIKLATHHDSIRIKSGEFNESGAFIYSTYKHTKYILPWGTNGVTQSWDDVIYIQKVNKGNVYFIDRSQGKIRKEALDTKEINFKIALHQGKLDRVAYYVKNAQLCGSAILGHLKRVGYPEVALSFIEDPLTRFNLAISYGNISEAKKCAEFLDKSSLWSRLADAAILHGKYAEAEAAYQRQRDFGRLIHLYLLTGNQKSLKRLVKPLRKVGDQSSLFFLCLLTGNGEERSNVLKSVGFDTLAARVVDTPTLLSQSVHGEEGNSEAWPISFVAKSPSSTAKYEASTTNFEQALEQVVDNTQTVGHKSIDEDGDWDLEDDFDDLLDDLELDVGPARSNRDLGKVVELSTNQLYDGTENLKAWQSQRPQNVAYAVQAGLHEEGLNILRRYVGIKNIKPFEDLFAKLVQTSDVYFQIPGDISVAVPKGLGEAPPMPSSLSVNEVERLNSKLDQLFLGKDPIIVEIGRHLVALCALLICSDPTSQDLEAIKEVMFKATQMMFIIRMEFARDGASIEENLRLLMLEAWAIKIPKGKNINILKTALTATFKAKNYLSAAELCRRVLRECEAEKRAAPAQVVQLLAKSESIATDAHALSVNTSDQFLAVCANSLKAIPGGYKPSATNEEVILCPLCDARALPEFIGQVCGLCNISELGLKTISSISH